MTHPKKSGLRGGNRKQALAPETEQSAKEAENIMPPILLPGLHFLIMSHDGGCPALETQSSLDCNCNAEVRSVDQAEYLRIVGGAK